MRYKTYALQNPTDARVIHVRAALLCTVLLLVPLSAALSAPAPPTSRMAPATDVSGIPGMRADRVVAPRGFFRSLCATRRCAQSENYDMLGLPPHPHSAQLHTVFIPSFSRQTKLPCMACHNQFPALTPFGRLFKLNGYTLTGLTPIATGDTTGRETLALAPIPPASAMVIVSTTHLTKPKSGTQNNTAAFPQQASIFFSGQVTPKIGAFTQFTYTQADAAIRIDNVDVRYATHLSVATHDLLAGITLHNNPTVQDVWNTVPAWSYPFVSSAITPSPLASTLIDGALAQQVLGLGLYSLYSNTLYTEATVYRSAPQGASGALDSTSTNTTRGVIPYWRVALQHQWPSTYLMVGTYGFAAQLYPQGVAGATAHFTDVALDAQVEHTRGKATVIGRATYIHERRNLGVLVGESPPLATMSNEVLSTVRANISVLPSQRYSFTAGYFQTTGTRDTLQFQPGAFTGSRTGSPNTSGATGDVAYNAWQNARIGAQYVYYRRFNGTTSAYDISAGRRAGDNNTLYLYTWLAF